SGFGNSGEWARFERNVALDWSSVTSGTWQYMDGVYFVNPLFDTGNPLTMEREMYVDMIRLSNSLTIEHNVLGPGVIGHILKNRQVNPANHSIADRWFHYDQVGTVLSYTD